MGSQNWLSGNLGRDAATGRWEGTIELIIPACCSVLDVSVTHLYRPRASQIPVAAQEILKNIPPKVKFSRQVKFQFQISGQAVGAGTRTRNFPSLALTKIVDSKKNSALRAVFFQKALHFITFLEE